MIIKDVAKAVVFLASELSGFVAGESIDVTGGV
jgi:NAD(P)-dependent dehydrogenase (short-subunit alcohol dehydrogenase family)